MTRLSLELQDHYPRRFIWWMECDSCQQTRSRPAWSQQDLPLEEFRALGWECGAQTDKCPSCIQAAERTQNDLDDELAGKAIARAAECDYLDDCD